MKSTPVPRRYLLRLQTCFHYQVLGLPPCLRVPGSSPSQDDVFFVSVSSYITRKYCELMLNREKLNVSLWSCLVPCALGLSEGVFARTPVMNFCAHFSTHAAVKVEINISCSSAERGFRSFLYVAPRRHTISTFLSSH